MPDGRLEDRLASIAALADPVRRALYRFVVAQPSPVGREAAAAGTGVAHHVAKFHLDKLVDEGLLDVDYRRPPGRGGPGAGRPAKLYRRSARELDVSVPERRYELAGRVLARAVHDAQRDRIPVGTALDHAAADAGRVMGDDIRERLGRRPSRATVMARTAEVVAEHGYEPRLERDAITLANCPFHRLAQDYTELVCGMNRCLLAAMLEQADPDQRAGLEAVLDPAPDRCCVRIVPCT